MPRLSWMILLPLLASFAIAADAPPTTAPGNTAQTTAPSSSQSPVPSDQSTPRGALKVFTIAMNRGDGDTVRAILVPGSPVEHRMVDALIAQRQAILKLGQTANTVFGAEGMRKLTGDVDATQAESIANIEGMTETITGDSAVINEGDAQLRFKKVNGKWVLPMSSLPNVDFGAADEAITRMKSMTQLFGEISAAIEAGKYKTAADAANDLQTKSFALAVKGSATQPSSAPTSQPSAG